MPPPGHNEADTRAKLIDQRTPQQLLADIEAKRREVDDALARLKELFDA